MTDEKIRPIALAIVHRGGRIRRNDQILVFESREPDAAGRIFYRPLGGTIEFGEYGRQALVREMREELGAEIENLRYLGLCENLFSAPDGQRAHEIVLLYEAELADRTLYEKDEMLSVEDSGETFRVLWKPLSFFQREEAPLYPNGLLELLLGEGTPYHPRAVAGDPNHPPEIR
jgi:8-oxo-dGTP pyrophosphatase MutT (NUDIX family)